MMGPNKLTMRYVGMTCIFNVITKLLDVVGRMLFLDGRRSKPINKITHFGLLSEYATMFKSSFLLNHHAFQFHF